MFYSPSRTFIANIFSLSPLSSVGTGHPSTEDLQFSNMNSGLPISARQLNSLLRVYSNFAHLALRGIAL
ncbi:hypothetical protein FGO68_gene2009 [Halteria grandinella]|uniref:Uncharacterized protein n=1 Tax=Halteria grandinella TaxID=5974 RepID=A0A8J8NUK8_HALGN|nr:hypothetical protein FGO68_gene2009 [Halteria grandinella]